MSTNSTESRCGTLSLGPDYRPDTQKPKATVSTQVAHENVVILPQTPQLIALMTYVSFFASTIMATLCFVLHGYG